MGTTKSKIVKIGQGTRWQNPFEESHSGEYALLAFTSWFYSSAYSAKRYREKAKDLLRDAELECSCGNEKTCHKQVITSELGD